MLYLARAGLGIAWYACPPNAASKKNQLKLLIMYKVVLFLTSFVCVKLCLHLLNNDLQQVGILPWYKSSSQCLNLGRLGWS